MKIKGFIEVTVIYSDGAEYLLLLPYKDFVFTPHYNEMSGLSKAQKEKTKTVADKLEDRYCLKQHYEEVKNLILLSQS